jgi:phospholipid transport system substrate-binding protein
MLGRVISSILSAQGHSRGPIIERYSMAKTFLRLALFLLVFLQAFALGAQELGPEELVRKVTKDVLETIQSDKQLQGGDRKKALALAEEKILPLLDFSEATRLAVGRAWRNATPEQRTRLEAEFRRMLVRVYSNAIGVYRGQNMRVQPVRMAANATEVTVRNQYISPGKQAVSVDYAMHKTPEGWKIYDIVAEGVSLVLTYRGEFEQVVQQSGVDGLIKALTEKNNAQLK